MEVLLIYLLVLLDALAVFQEELDKVSDIILKINRLHYYIYFTYKV